MWLGETDTGEQIKLLPDTYPDTLQLLQDVTSLAPSINQEQGGCNRIFWNDNYNDDDNDDDDNEL